MAVDPVSFIRRHQSGILSTHSQRYSGFPFGSVVPYLISPGGRIAIFISDLAEHTHNILADNRVALTISETKHNESPAGSARITLLGNALLSEQQSELRLHYQTQFADADSVLELYGFHFFELELIAVRLIAGFGEIGWLPPEHLLLAAD
jgi:hypothetical protein